MTTLQHDLGVALERARQLLETAAQSPSSPYAVLSRAEQALFFVEAALARLRLAGGPPDPEEVDRVVTDGRRSGKGERSARGRRKSAARVRRRDDTGAD